MNRRLARSLSRIVTHTRAKEVLNAGHFQVPKFPATSTAAPNPNPPPFQPRVLQQVCHLAQDFRRRRQRRFALAAFSSAGTQQTSPKMASSPLAPSVEGVTSGSYIGPAGTSPVFSVADLPVSGIWIRICTEHRTFAWRSSMQVRCTAMSSLLPWKDRCIFRDLGRRSSSSSSLSLRSSAEGLFKSPSPKNQWR